MKIKDITPNPNANIPLLRKALEWAEEEAEKPFAESQWRQASWVVGPGRALVNPQGEYETKCGTAYCFAGWTAYATLGEHEDLRLGGDILDKTTGKRVTHCEDRAIEELGITPAEADALFYADNSIKRLRKIAEAIAGERL